LPRVIRVRYEKGVLKPLGEVELREGEELEVAIAHKSFRGFREEAGKYEFRVDRDLVGEFVGERR
jgi:predicted DNA-binding antitoxin AbrB/MazE fold protein